MLDKLRQFITDVVAPSAPDELTLDEGGYRLAATALLIHVISIDGDPSEVEKQKLHALLEQRFGLDAATASRLIASATLIEGEAVDLYHFTSVIMRSVNEQGRLRIVEMMWELVYADGTVTEFEENVVWRAADLLAVSTRDRVTMRQKVAAEAPVAPSAAAQGGTMGSMLRSIRELTRNPAKPRVTGTRICPATPRSISVRFGPASRIGPCTLLASRIRP